MRYEFPLRPGRDYVCPPDAGPAWRAAYEAGVDMAELEDNLKLAPMERLQKKDLLVAEHLKREAFLKFLQRGSDLIKANHARRTHH